MTPPISEIWVYLSASPLLGLTITLLAYQGAFWLYRRSGMNPLANPVLIAVTILVLLLTLTATSYETYFAGAQFVHFLLGPATVALAVPLYTQFRRVRSLLLPVLAGLVAGSLTAALSAIAVARLFDASLPTQLSLAPKSVTTPIAMGIAERIGGLPALAAVFAVATGVVGAVLGRYVFDAAGVSDLRARGFALGLAAHGIGTARAFQVDRDAGTYAGLAFGLHALAAALAMPLAVAAWRALAG